MSRVTRASKGGRPRLVLVTYSFPPARFAGTVRTWNIAKYLSREGWAVSVLTVDPALWHYVEEPEATEAILAREGIRRLAAAHRWRWLASSVVKCPQNPLAWLAGGIGRRVVRVFGIEPTVGWVRPAQKASLRLRPGEVDMVLASGPSFSAFPLARRLAQRLQCAYVLDYRDLWSMNLHNPAPTAVRTEASLLAGSAAVTTVSPSWALILNRRFSLGSKVHVVSNGYDSEALASVERYPFGHFAIVYTGALWPPKRTISPVMDALRRVKERRGEHVEWMFHYYGRHGQHVREEAERFGVGQRVVVHGEVSRAEALAAVKGAGVSVVVTSVAQRATLEDNGMVTGKIFEAIGLSTPILVVAPSGSDASAVGDAAGLGRSFTAGDVEGIASFLCDIMSGTSLKPKDPTAYAWENVVKTLDHLLRRVL